MKGQWPLSVGELGSQGVEQFGRSEALVSFLDHQLAFLDHVHELDPDQCVLGVVYLQPADNYLVPKTGYNVPLSRHCEGGMR